MLKAASAGSDGGMVQGDVKKTIVLAVGGMTCQMCVGHVEGALRGVPGVIAVNVALDPPQAIVTLALDSVTIVDDLIAAVHEEGYDASVLV
jgi:Cu+-exporting ATPase